ncbi:Protein of unknown function [Bacillus mycoides]|nr:Protein of unknown function [Bacillus mycoides]
MNAAGMYSE